ncbi:hypothetical protein BJ322DRAFT_1110520 [Thelephora terrestris]|uniref:Ribonuclease H1 N-terminal domain-containing protein n=1 Tax=Thelephora terrestris TaxID=56493 RepID=A0A9P6L511_9AGAM|nr:hypothetical protein BJ322DRAFT_1110520 [Thelephora terrestris]
MQTQGFSDPFQRIYPNFESAESAWNAYIRDKIYPDYGKSPWVVFLGNKPGVFTKVSELEASVKGYDGAVFRACSSVSEGKIKFEIFSGRVHQMFNVSDPFAGVEALMPQLAEDACETTPGAQSITPAPVTPVRSPLPCPSQLVESSRAASKRKAVDSPPALIPQDSYKGSRPGDGWYVVHTGVLPGVYYGVDALKSAKLKPGGFTCALNKDDAENLFLALTVNCALVFVKE